MQTKRVLIWDPLPESGQMDWVIGYASQEGVVVEYMRPHQVEERPRLAADADAIVLVRQGLSLQDLKTCPHLRCVYCLTSDAAVDAEASRWAGVSVVNLEHDAFSTAVAEHTMALLLGLCKGLYPGMRDRVAENRLGFETALTEARTYRYNWAAASPVSLRGKTLGLIGFGHIGRKMATLATPFGMRIVYTSRRPPDEPAAGVHRRGLRDLCSESDFVSIHVPYTLETHHLIDADVLRLLKPTAFLINTSRGRVVDEDALVKALSARAFRGAALDVFREEPLSPDHPLLRLDNVILTPHIAAGVLEVHRASSN